MESNVIHASHACSQELHLVIIIMMALQTNTKFKGDRKKGLGPKSHSQMATERPQRQHISFYLVPFNFFTCLQMAVILVQVFPDLSPFPLLHYFKFFPQLLFPICKIGVMSTSSLDCCANENEIIPRYWVRVCVLPSLHNFKIT